MAVLSTTDVRALLAEHGLRPSRALGQNFLADPNTAARIARLAEVDSTDRVLEIGPGLGSLTLALATTGASVLAIELDRRLVPVLEAVVSATPNVTVEQGDALELDFARRLSGGEWSCVSNLPYNVATPVVMRLLDDVPQITRLLVMVQREVGERLAAPPGTRASGAVSVRIAWHAEARVVGAVPASVFVPRPRVESVLVRLDRRRTPPVDVSSSERMFELVRGDRASEALTAAGIDVDARPEALDLRAWAALSEEVGP
jgi:16S rRNA (adenine1518-N6/adenine1519-N6)-dimethyltransferase